MLSKFLIALGVLLVLAVAAVLIGPRFVDWNAYREEIAAKVEEATGRELEIAGDISVGMLPPTLSVEQVRLANIEGGSAPDMATLDALEVRIAPWPLLRGEIRVERIALVNPTILLETTADGRSNWRLGEDAGPAGTPETTPEAALGDGRGSGPEVSLDNLSIQNGTVVYRDAGAERRIEGLDAEITAETLRGPFHAAGRALVGGAPAVPVTFEITTGRLAEGESAALGLVLRHGEADAALRFNGRVTLQGADSRARGRLEATAPSLAQLLAALSGTGGDGGGLPFAEDQDLALTGTLDASATAVALEGVSFRIGETSGSGAATLVPGAPAKADVTLAFNRLDLDSLLASGGDDGPATGAGAPGDGAAAGGGGASAFALPTGVAADIEMTAAALIYRAGLINNLRLDASLADGELELERLSALLPGGSDIALAGRLAAGPESAKGGAPRFTGSLEANATNFRGLLAWLELGLPEVPSDRLRSMSLVSRISATPKTVEITDIDLRLDSSRVRGGVVIALPTGPRYRMPAFGIGLAVDQVNLDAYLPAATPAAGDTAEGEAADAEKTAGLPPAFLTGGLAPLATLAANLDLRFGSLVYNRQTLQGVHLDGTMQNGTLTLRELSVQEFAGGQGSLSGTITDLAGAPRFDTKFDLTTQDAGRALALAGLARPAPEGLGALSLGGTLSGAAEEVAYDVSFSLAGFGTKGTAQGTVAGLGAGPPSLGTSFEIAARDPGPLLGLAGLPAAAGSRLGALSVSGSAASSAAKGGLSYDLTAGAEGIGGTAQLSGTLTDLAAPAAAIDATLQATVERPAPLLALAGLQAPEEPLGPFSLAAKAQGTTERVELSDLAFEAGPSTLTGSVALDRSGRRPRLTADLRGGQVALGWLAAAGGQGQPPADDARAEGAGDGRWSDAPLDLSALEALDAEVALAADALLLGGSRVEEAELALTLDQGVLAIDRFAGKAFGGAVEMTGELTSRSVPAATAKLAATEVSLDRLLGDGALAEQVRGPVSIEADLRTSGLSLADMIGALQGTGAFRGTVTVLAPAEQRIGSALLGILGAKVEGVRGVTDRIGALYAAFAGEPNALSGTFRIETGVLRTEDTTLTGAGGRATAAGIADLEAWALDMAARVYRPESAEEPVLTVDLTGPIDAPNVGIEGAALSSGGTLGGLLEEMLPGPAGAAPRTEEAPAPEPPASEPEEPAGSFEALIPGLIEKLRQRQEE